MTTYVPAKKGAEYIFYIGLVSQSTGQFQSNPTLAAGDFKVSKDGGALSNLATLPAVTPASSKSVKVTLSTTEMDADNIVVIGSDAAGAEWDDVFVNIQTAARQIDDLATPTNITAGTITTATNVTTVNGLAANVITAASIAADASAEIADAVWDELKSGHTVADSFGDYLDDEITSRATAADIPSASTVADAVWDEDATGHQTQGTFGQAIGDPAADSDTIWGLVNTNLNATISSRATQTSLDTLDDFVDTEVAAIKAVTDALPNAGALTTIQADLDNIQTRLPAALSGDGFMKADLKSIEDELTSGNNATLNLKNVSIFYSGSSAPAVSISADNDAGLYISSDNYNAVDIFGGPNNHGINIETSGTGKSINAPQDIETTNPIEANIKEVNDVALTGDGSTTPWGPA